MTEERQHTPRFWGLLPSIDEFGTGKRISLNCVVKQACRKWGGFYQSINIQPDADGRYSEEQLLRAVNLAQGFHLAAEMALAHDRGPLTTDGRTLETSL